MDIVYTLKTYPSQDLLYSVRSIAENLPHNKVFFAGGFTNWAKDIIYIPTVQNGKTKWHNQVININTACRWELVSDDFILMNDDFYLMRPIDKVKNYHNGHIQRRIDTLADNGYRRSLEETRDWLKAKGIANPLSYELHIPMIINKQDKLELHRKYNIPSHLQQRSIYGNMCAIEAEYLEEDVKVYRGDETNRIGGLERATEMRDTEWVSITDKYMTTDGFRDIKRRFKNKCRYEY
jgi:hypothetical protein